MQASFLSSHPTTVIVVFDDLIGLHPKGAWKLIGSYAPKWRINPECAAACTTLSLTRDVGIEVATFDSAPLVSKILARERFPFTAVKATTPKGLADDLKGRKNVVRVYHPHEQYAQLYGHVGRLVSPDDCQPIAEFK
mgnify:FL=1